MIERRLKSESEHRDGEISHLCKLVTISLSKNLPLELILAVTWALDVLKE